MQLRRDGQVGRDESDPLFLRCGVVLKKGFWEKVISQLRLDGCLRVLWLVRGRGRSMCQT